MATTGAYEGRRGWGAVGALFAVAIGSLVFPACDGEDGYDGGGDDDGAADDDGAGDDGQAEDGAAADDGANQDDGEDDGGDGDEGGAEALGFQADILPILAASCGCHTGGAPSAGLDLSAAAAYAALVEVESSAGPAFVVPGDASASYLVNKLDGSQADVGGGGARMPTGGELPAADIDRVADWIDAGALP